VDFLPTLEGGVNGVCDGGLPTATGADDGGLLTCRDEEANIL
jgi:hypothetical protein